ncbi:hypothetical protein NYO98_06500 [Nocardioides sp. STR2]|uniref:Nucleoside 2-deoxyribosyltransferase n=1 Tax=Nocardioides pini TaxID=2975053 RepID=A0ABT4CBZ0_9ACTN|nr:hypothetical protein [Nocardioides pini]MCY4725921.1 hypothetical protein [Nocardioides pini]
MDIDIFVASEGPHKSRIESAVSLLNGVQSEFRLAVRSAPDTAASISSDGTLDPRRALEAASRFDGQRHKVWIADAPFTDNWFSHEDRITSVITTADWEKHFSPPSLRTYVTYQLAQTCTVFAADLSEEMLGNIAHEPPRGCANDLSLDKANIRFGMIAGSLCPECAALLSQYGVSAMQIEAVRRMLALVRDDALGIARPLEPLSAFVVMRFSEFDENANAYTYGVKAGIEAAGLTCTRADDAYQPGTLLTKVTHYIERSRVIVAKVDVQNLNVYYEVGVARALGKDIVLVAAKEQVGVLPTDINNLEVLTYPTGDYETLRDSLEQALKPLVPRG